MDERSSRGSVAETAAAVSFELPRLDCGGTAVWGQDERPEAVVDPDARIATSRALGERSPRQSHETQFNALGYAGAIVRGWQIMNDRFGLPKPKSITPRFTEAELAQGARAGPAADQGPRGRGEGAPLSAGSNSERDTSRSPPIETRSVAWPTLYRRAT